MITEEIPHNLKSQANVVSICFPATYLPTSDPLLINDCLLQLGDHPISRQKVQDPANSMDLAATNVLKIQLFRDELGSIWEDVMDVANLPIRPYGSCFAWCPSSSCALPFLAAIAVATTRRQLRTAWIR